MNIKDFWLKNSNLISWHKKPSVAFKKLKKNYIEWFPDGKLNAYYNCVTINLKSDLKNKIAIYYISKDKKVEKYTYKEFDNIVRNFSDLLLKKLGKKIKNSKIIIHGSASIETAMSMMACAKLGIHFSVIFEDLAPAAISSRLSLIKPNLFITRTKEQKFKNEILNKIKILKKTKFIYLNKKSISKINKKNLIDKDISFNSNRDLFTLFTSGSTGTPKGIVHATGGYLLATKLTCIKKFGMKKNSVIVTASNAGWLNGHTYALFGPLSLGATTVILEDPMLLIDENLLKKVLKLNTSILYLPVTIIRLMKSLFKKKKFKTKYLKTLGSMGEHLAPSVAKWFANTFTNKNNAIVNAYYQTENGAIIASPTFEDKIFKVPHGSVGKVTTKFLKTNITSAIKKNEIKLTTPWPGNMKRILNGEKEWEKYWDRFGNFRMFDLATKKKDNLYIHGRNDDVINVRGHRIGCEEIESTILKIDNIKECCAVSLPDKFEGEILYLFVVSKIKDLDKNIHKEIINNFGSFAVPSKIYRVKELPKTRSGKILRRFLREIILNQTLKKMDLNVLSDKAVLENILKTVKNNG